jgi:hypothetical protein
MDTQNDNVAIVTDAAETETPLPLGASVVVDVNDDGVAAPVPKTAAPIASATEDDDGDAATAPQPKDASPPVNKETMTTEQVAHSVLETLSDLEMLELSEKFMKAQRDARAKREAEESAARAAKKAKGEDKSEDTADKSKDQKKGVPGVSDEIDEWPPKDWTDNFQHSKHAIYRLKNNLTYKLAREKTTLKPTSENVDPMTAKSAIALMFCTEKKYGRNFKQKNVRVTDFGAHSIPDMQGPCKKIFIHIPTLQAIQRFRNHYGSCGLEFHRIPHPKLPGIWCVSEIYLLSGNEIAAELKTPYRCHYCNAANAQRLCHCEKVHFCSLRCQDVAVIDRVHTPMQCDELLSQSLIDRSIAAKKRMIAIKDKLEEDEKFGKQIAVVAQRQLEDAQKEVEMSKKTADEYFKAKRERLQATSALARYEQGMERDPNIPDELQVGGARHKAALLQALPKLVSDTPLPGEIITPPSKPKEEQPSPTPSTAEK